MSEWLALNYMSYAGQKKLSLTKFIMNTINICVTNNKVYQLI